MAGPASNFDAEIKKGMRGNNKGKGGGPVAGDQQPGKSSSTNTAPAKAPAATGKQNQWNQPPGPQSQDGVAGGSNGDTHAAMIAAGQAHMNAIHQHINAITSGKGAGGDVPVNQGTAVK